MFHSREEAGMLLAEKLKKFEKKFNTLVIGIPRGGVVVAKVVAQRLKLPLDIVVVRKIGAPTNPELAIGAVSSASVYWDSRLYRRLGVTQQVKAGMKEKKLQEVREREKNLRGDSKPLLLRGKTLLLIDDGVATGATVLAAQRFLKKMKAAKIILAIPVIAKDTLNNISKYFDEVITLQIEESFYAVGQFYEEFPQVNDHEVVELLSNS